MSDERYVISTTEGDQPATRRENRYPPRRSNRSEGRPYTWPKITLEGAMSGP